MSNIQYKLKKINRKRLVFSFTVFPVDSLNFCYFILYFAISFYYSNCADAVSFDFPCAGALPGCAQAAHPSQMASGDNRRLPYPALQSGLQPLPLPSAATRGSGHRDSSFSPKKGYKKIGATGFEPTTSASRTQRSTKLSHAPIKLEINPTFDMITQMAKKINS